MGRANGGELLLRTARRAGADRSNGALKDTAIDRGADEPGPGKAKHDERRDEKLASVS